MSIKSSVTRLVHPSLGRFVDIILKVDRSTPFISHRHPLAHHSEHDDNAKLTGPRTRNDDKLQLKLSIPHQVGSEYELSPGSGVGNEPPGENNNVTMEVGYTVADAKQPTARSRRPVTHSDEQATHVE